MPVVAVTGSSGKLGRAVVAELDAHGWTVVCLDRTYVRALGSLSIAVDLTDFGQALDALTGVDNRYHHVDALVHLAAISAPGLHTNAETFRHNMMASYNVLAAAGRAGIKNIVWASSETVLGLPFDQSRPPPYLPVDEQYDPRPNTTYSLVKTLEEEMARQLCRWDPDLALIGLRFSNVKEPSEYADFAGFQDDPGLRRRNLWAYVDARDGAQAVRLALEHDGTGADVFVIAARDTVMTTPNQQLLAEFFPEVAVRGELGPHDTLLSIDKARRVLGYQPRYSWRTHVQFL